MGLLRYSALLLLLGAVSVQAQTRYVSDELTITLRTGPSTRNAIIRNLTSGDLVEVLQEMPEEGYSRVRVADGTEGWVITRYLQNDRTGDQELAAAERNLAAARERVAALETQVNELTAALAATEGALDDAEASGQSLSTQLADIRSASANAIELRDQNESLRRRATELSAQVDVMAMESAELAGRSRQNWFIVGAAVLFGGVVIGLVAPSLRPRRKSTW